jgi:hypothetical protein
VIVGDPSNFAIESSITKAYERPSFRALGFFIVHVGGRVYGRRTPDSTLLAGAWDEIGGRIADRGQHTAPFATKAIAGEIARAFRNAVYGESPDEGFFGIPREEFVRLLGSHHLDDWAPCCDEAFDDGSYLAHFDVEDRVRLIAYKSKGWSYDPDSLAEVWVSAEDFYRILQDWHDAFEAEWKSLPKTSMADDGADPPATRSPLARG